MSINCKFCITFYSYTCHTLILFYFLHDLSRDYLYQLCRIYKAFYTGEVFWKWTVGNKKIRIERKPIINIYSHLTLLIDYYYYCFERSKHLNNYAIIILFALIMLSRYFDAHCSYVTPTYHHKDGKDVPQNQDCCQTLCILIYE